MTAYGGIDPRVLEEITGGNPLLADKIVDGYLTVSGDEIQKLSTLLAEGDKAELRRQAHRVVGSSATVGAVAVEQAARALEEAVIGGDDLPTLSTLIEHVAEAFGALSRAPEA